MFALALAIAAAGLAAFAVAQATTAARETIFMGRDDAATHAAGHEAPSPHRRAALDPGAGH
jgi:hypothetical protein